jgi:hypothetical protein
MMYYNTALTILYSSTRYRTCLCRLYCSVTCYCTATAARITPSAGPCCCCTNPNPPAPQVLYVPIIGKMVAYFLMFCLPIRSSTVISSPTTEPRLLPVAEVGRGTFKFKSAPCRQGTNENERTACIGRIQVFADASPPPPPTHGGRRRV